MNTSSSNTFLLKGRCQHCEQPLSFTAAEAGQTVACPTCFMETVLFAPPKTQVITPPPPKERATFLAILAFVFGFGGFFMTGFGFVTFIISSRSTSVFQEIEAILLITGGCVTLLLSFILAALVRLIEK